VLYANGTNEQTGEAIELEGESLEELQGQLPEGYDGASIEVRDEAGSLKGWINGETWRAA
jgi:hypothetical protein